MLTEPWPAMLRTIWGDDERYEETYWSRFPGRYFAGDGAKKDEDGDIWLLGRVDDVMNVSGHRISTTEVESALVSHPTVAEAAVVGATDATTGQGIVAFVILRGDAVGDRRRRRSSTELRNHVAKEIGPIAKPRQIMVVAELPKTRSGKIMRRLLRDVAENRELGDVTTLADPHRDGPDRAGPGRRGRRGVARPDRFSPARGRACSAPAGAARSRRPSRRRRRAAPRPVGAAAAVPARAPSPTSRAGRSRS